MKNLESKDMYLRDPDDCCLIDVFRSRCFFFRGGGGFAGRTIILSGVTNMTSQLPKQFSRGERYSTHLCQFYPHVGGSSHILRCKTGPGVCAPWINRCHQLQFDLNFNMLLGASDADKQDQHMRVIVYCNWFKYSMQPMPYCW
jgi:hypothetical protein